MSNDDLSYDAGMEVPEEEGIEGAFRRGASQTARWFMAETETMVQEKRGAPEIATRLRDLTAVLFDWRSDQFQKKLESYPPWEWTREEIDHLIEKHKSEN